VLPIPHFAEADQIAAGAGLGFLCIVLLLLAFDERQATRAVRLARRCLCGISISGMLGTADDKNDFQKGSFLGPDYSKDVIKKFLNEKNIPYKELAESENSPKGCGPDEVLRLFFFSGGK